VSELTWILGVIAAAAGGFALNWWLKRPTISRFLQEDITSIVHETMCWAKPGATLHLYAQGSQRGISVTKLDDSSGTRHALRIAIRGKDPDRAAEELARRLIPLGLRESSGRGSNRHEAGSLVLSGIPEPATLGRVAILGLEVAGLSAGDTIVHKFDGEIEMDAVKHYRKTHLRRRLQQ